MIIDLEFFKCAFVNTLEEQLCTKLKLLETALLRRHFKQGPAEKRVGECRALASQVIFKTLQNNTKLYEAVQHRGTG